MWITKDKNSVWVEMEQKACLNISLESLPFLNEKTWRKVKMSNEWVRGTLKIWSKVPKKSLNYQMALAELLR